jgi:hypothetical protein
MKAINSLIAFFQNARRVSCDYCVGRDISGHHAAGADDGVFADGDAAEDGGVGAKRSPCLDDRGNDLPVGLGLQTAAVAGGSGVEVVDEHDAVADEDIVLNGHALADKGVALDLAVSADGGVFLDFDKCADLAAFANRAAVKVDEFVELDVFAQFDIRRYIFHSCVPWIYFS